MFALSGGILKPGEFHALDLGEGTTLVSVACFIDTPRPPGPGFHPCPECTTADISDQGVLEFKCPEFALDNFSGRVELVVRLRSGVEKTLNFEIAPDSDSTPTAGFA